VRLLWGGRSIGDGVRVAGEVEIFQLRSAGDRGFLTEVGWLSIRLDRYHQ
jgi:hypothetical protein